MSMPETEEPLIKVLPDTETAPQRVGKRRPPRIEPPVIDPNKKTHTEPVPRVDPFGFMAVGLI